MTKLSRTRNWRRHLRSTAVKRKLSSVAQSVDSSLERRMRSLINRLGVGNIEAVVYDI